MINLYYHGGSSNHGCEAIVRATQKIVGQDLSLFTRNIEADRKYGLESVVVLKEDTFCPPKSCSIRRLLSAFHYKITHTDYLFTKYARHVFFSKVKKNQVYMSIGGDNYCYAGRDVLGYYNQIIHEKGAKTVLWGCSFETTELDSFTEADLKRYNLIIARESLSYEVLKKINDKTVLIPDPAFLLDKIERSLPEGFIEGNTVGINISPLILKCENDCGITVRNYKKLINYIIEKTDMQIALIPHVVEEQNDDREALNIFYEAYSDTGRIIMIDDCNAMELKGVISKCRYFVGARTHATIAAYSTGVPTLVVGYSVKAKGIAKDIFGQVDNYVLPVQNLQREEELLEAFRWLEKNEKKIVEHLNLFMPSYCEKAWQAGELVRSLEEECTL